MSKKIITLLIVLGVIGIAIFSISGFLGGKYNTMVGLDEDVNKAWSQVETQYQRRADLIPNLVNTVKGFAEHEKEVLTEVTKARASATQMNIDPTKLTPEVLEKFQQAQGGLSSALSRLLLVQERYPELKSDKHFLELQAQLEGTENRIAVERNRYNESTTFYNKYIRSFPNNFVAGWFDFEKRPLFESTPGSDVAPTVNF